MSPPPQSVLLNIAIVLISSVVALAMWWSAHYEMKYWRKFTTREDLLNNLESQNYCVSLAISWAFALFLGFGFYYLVVALTLGLRAVMDFAWPP